jgi:hypothetical protein
VPFSELDLKLVERSWAISVAAVPRPSLKWQSYKSLSSGRDIRELMAEIDHDPHGFFLG